MKKNDKLAALDQAIEQETATIQALETNLQRTQQEKDKATAEQQAIAYDALTGCDKRAQAQLQECEQALSKFSARAQSIEAALRTAKGKLHDLHEKRQAIFIAEKRAEYSRECSALIKEDGECLERVLVQMSETRDAFRLRLKRLETIAQEAGLDAARTHNKIKTNLGHCLNARAGFDTGIWLNKEARTIFTGPVPIVLRSTLDGLLTDLETEPEQQKAS